MSFSTIDYLATGNPKQQEVYRLLQQYAVWDILLPYTPLLAGTIPIAIDIDTSDLDIICCWQDQTAFIAHICQHFAHYQHFRIIATQVRQRETVIANFVLDGFEIEIFGQNRPSAQQEAFRHLLIEHEILLSRDNDFRQQIIALKQAGWKTEQAFAHLLGLSGNPYIALLQYHQP